MAQRGADEITLVDLTDGVSVVLSSESYAFPGSTSAALAGSTTTKIQALMGGEYVAASVNVAAVTKPANVTVTSDNHATSPTLTIAVTTAVTTAGEIVIPVVVDGLTIEKRFSFAIAFKGTTGTTGTAGTSATIVGLKNEASMIVTDAVGAAVAASTVSVDFYGYVGATRTAVTAVVSGLPTGMTASTNTPGTTGADGILTLSIASGATLGGANSGVVTVALTCNGITRNSYFAWSKAKAGADGSDGTNGAAAIVVEVSSSSGLLFKNTQVATTLTAKVYQGGVELTAPQISALGAIKWYKDGAYLTGLDGATLTVTAGQVTDRATYEAKLEY